MTKQTPLTVEDVDALRNEEVAASIIDSTEFLKQTDVYSGYYWAVYYEVPALLQLVYVNKAEDYFVPSVFRFGVGEPAFKRHFRFYRRVTPPYFRVHGIDPFTTAITATTTGDE